MGLKTLNLGIEFNELQITKGGGQHLSHSV